MKKRRMILVWSMTVLALASCAGGGSGADAPDVAAGKEDPKNDRKDQEAQTAGAGEDSGAQGGAAENPDAGGAPENPAAGESWEQAYAAYLTGTEGADLCTYSLIYVDADEIPELVTDTGVEAGGCQILTWHDGTLDVLQTSRLYFTYIERGNLLCNSDGHMGYYYDDVYAIKDGVWKYVEGGNYHDPAEGPQLDENEEFIYEYEWQGEPVEAVEYEHRLYAVYPGDQAKEPETYYIRDEMISVLETGKTTSADHRYELIVEDLTWTQARAACEARGGYLATITSAEEFGRIQELIRAEEKTSVTFFVGAANKGDTFGYVWLEPGAEQGYDMLALYRALFAGFWLEGEPSYRGITEDGQEVKEDCVSLIYRSSEGRCYLNDVADDILAEAPSFAGRVGYICEYDE